MATVARLSGSSPDGRVLPSAAAPRRPARRRFSRRLRRWLALGGAGVVLAWTGWEVLARLPWMPISEVAVIGAEVVDTEGIRDAAGVSVSAPIFSVNDDSVIRRVEALPWVLHAHVRRRLSGKFEIHVVERTPVGLIWRDEFHLLDASGYTVRLGGRTPPDVPLVTGLSRIGPEARGRLERIGWALSLVSELDPLRSVVSEVSLADSTMLVMLLAPTGTPVFFPRQPGRDRFVMLASVVASHPEVVRQARYLDARFSGHVAVGS